MSVDAWHVDEALWVAYAEGRLDTVVEASVEAHVARCATCREGARAQVAPAELAGMWAAIRADVRRPAEPRTTRWLRRLGVPDGDAVVVAASDGLMVAWAVAVGAALTCAMLAGLVPSRQDETFLLLAPLIPVLAVVAAYDATDSVRSLASTTPYSKLRLALLRTSATLVVALPVTLAVGLGIPGLEPLAFTWLLPALALTSATLVALTWLGAWAASGAVGATWTAVVLTTAGFHEVTALTQVATQVGFGAVLVAMAAALVARTTPWRITGGES